MMQRYLLGIDNGLTGIKAVLFDLEGRKLACGKSPTPLENRGSGIVEMDPKRLWETTASVIRMTIGEAGVDPGEIAAVANSAHGNGLYMLDNAGKPLTRAILPMDHRSKNIVDGWTLNSKSEELFAYTLQKAWPGQPAAILRWIKEHRPSLYGQIGKVLLCKDWLKYKLTGKSTTDYSDASAAGLLDCRSKSFSEKLFELYGIPEMLEKLPSMLKSWEVCGAVTGEAAAVTGLKEGTPVAAGMFDVNACCLGSGIYTPGTYSIIAGTWGINSTLSAKKVRSKQIVQCTVFADGEQYLCIDSGATSSVNLEWFLKSTYNPEGKTDYGELEKIIVGFTPAVKNILFLPYIYQSIHNPKVNASFIGLKAEHGWEDMLCAVYEGIALGHGLQLQRLGACGLKGNTAVFSGGASRSVEWCKIFADVVGISLETRAEEQAGALGAAMAAAIAAGLFKDIRQAAEKMVRKKDIYTPSLQNNKVYQQRMETMKRLLDFFNSLHIGYM